ncbi:MAG: UDP-N-acetylmuramoyl-L-alanine--D-glutamate ligase [Myxococcota bacterium]|nr:UDP-N-acetylmuramoyl-L-alanine--D-glutamate ligase [Myxococcota bacterium]
MLDLAGQSVLVLGLGLSGRSAARFCAARGARVVAADERPDGELQDLGGLGALVELRVGAPFPGAADFDLVVPSPGVPPERYRAGARRVWGDVELAARALPVPIVAVTGTNGKSTTTHLVAEALRAAGLRAAAAGNVGEPALDLVGEPLDVAVLEVSSFQLETTESFRPHVAVILNLSPDHLDRHGSFEAYRDAKARILANQKTEDAAVLGFDDPVVRALADAVQGRLVPFSTRSALEHGAWLDGSQALLRGPGAALHRVSLAGLRLAGAHNRENALAALAAAWAAGADPERAARGLERFAGLPHRMEDVGQVAGVHYVNDSKATNPGAALRSLTGSEAPLVWIAGGRDKGLDFAPLAEAAAGRVRVALLVGEAAGKLEAALAGRVETRVVASVEEAVREAAGVARPGDVVLLAPACASQDQFRDFAERGDCFRAAVARLVSGGGAC